MACIHAYLTAVLAWLVFVISPNQNVCTPCDIRAACTHSCLRWAIHLHSRGASHTVFTLGACNWLYKAICACTRTHSHLQPCSAHSYTLPPTVLISCASGGLLARADGGAGGCDTVPRTCSRHAPALPILLAIHVWGKMLSMAGAEGWQEAHQPEHESRSGRCVVRAVCEC